MCRIILISLLILSIKANAQTMGGSWYGKADVVLDGTYNNYLTELVIKQKGNTVEGIFGYYFRNGYQSFYVKGTYDPKTRQVSIPNIPVVFYKANTIDGVTCNMSFEGTLRVSKVGSFVRGAFNSDSKYKYLCPELRVLFSMDSLVQKDSVISNGVAKKLWQPSNQDVVVIDDPDSKDGLEIKTATPSADLTKPDIKSPVIDGNALVTRFKKRQNIVANELKVASDSVRISFYDNGDIDGDSISVFLNGVPVLEKQMISAKALTIYVKLDPTKEYNEISMFAENLGRIPPNTALMVVYDGDTPQEIFLTSSFSQNGTVRIRQRPKQSP